MNKIRKLSYIKLSTKWLEILLLSGLVFFSLGCNWFDKNNQVSEPMDEVVLPSAEFTSAIIAGKAPLEIQFNDRSTNGSGNINNWQWDFGDGASSNEQNPLHTYDSSGVFSVSLTVTSVDGSTTETKLDYISVEPADVVVKLQAIDQKGMLLNDLSVTSADYSIESTEGAETGTRISIRPTTTDGVLRVSKSGYIDQIVFLEGVQSNLSKRITLLKKSSPIKFDGFVGGEFFVADGARVKVDGESLIRPDGSIATGEIELFITPVDINDPVEVTAFPGSFYGQEDQQSDQTELFSYGVVDISFEQNGEILDLKEGSVAEVSIPFYANKDYLGNDIVAGNQIPFWYLDELTGIWMLESQGIIVEDALSPTGFSLSATTTHFTAFNSDINPPGLQRGGAGGGNSQSSVCSLNVALTGISTGEVVTYYLIYQAAGWPTSRSERQFIFDGSMITHNILRGFLITVIAKTAEAEGSTSFVCNNETEVTKSIALGEAPPEIISWESRAEAVFGKDSNGNYEVQANKIYMALYFINAELALVDSPLLNTATNFVDGIYKEIDFPASATDPAEFNVIISNAEGDTTETKLVAFVTEQIPTVELPFAYTLTDGIGTKLSWINLQGADLVEVYDLGEDADSNGVYVTELEDPQQNFETELVGITGAYIRLDLINQYGTNSFIIAVGGEGCIPGSELPGCIIPSKQID